MTHTSGPTAQSIRHGALGQLFAADGSSVPVSITHSGDDLLVLILDATGQFTRSPLTNLTLESTSGRGVLRTPGFAEHIGPNLLKFIVDDARHVLQRREFVRVQAAQRVRLENAEGIFLFEAYTINISGGGMLIRPPRRAPTPSGELLFTILLNHPPADMQVVSGAGRVVRTRAPDEAAINFTAISHADQERLIRFIFDAQRKALAFTRGDYV
ncbi:MAG: PilZ domain-containing protein [Solirubrobacteraceae bacterium]